MMRDSFFSWVLFLRQWPVWRGSWGFYTVYIAVVNLPACIYGLFVYTIMFLSGYVCAKQFETPTSTTLLFELQKLQQYLYLLLTHTHTVISTPLLAASYIMTLSGLWLVTNDIVCFKAMLIIELNLDLTVALKASTSLRSQSDNFTPQFSFLLF